MEILRALKIVRRIDSVPSFVRSPFHSSNVECVAWFLFFPFVFFLYIYFLFCFFWFHLLTVRSILLLTVPFAVVFCSHPLHLQFVVVGVHTVLDGCCVAAGNTDAEAMKNMQNIKYNLGRK